MFTFGPIPSRRLGFSLGINHIPPKNCTFTCVYCQVGRSTYLSTERREFFKVADIMAEAKEKIEQCHQNGLAIDFLTLVPDGEPTLDLNLEKLIIELKGLGYRVAVISNASLIDQVPVQQALIHADWVSLKVDAVQEAVWRKIDRPNRHLSLPAILEGIKAFNQKFEGELVTETMLVSGINDGTEQVLALADYLLALKPDKSYLSIPTRPPSEPWVSAPSVLVLAEVLSQLAQKKVDFIDLLFEPEKLDFATSGNLAEAILSITAVHPLRVAAMNQILAKAGADWCLVRNLLDEGSLVKIDYLNETFYRRAFQ